MYIYAIYIPAIHMLYLRYLHATCTFIATCTYIYRAPPQSSQSNICERTVSYTHTSVMYINIQTYIAYSICKYVNICYISVYIYGIYIYMYIQAIYILHLHIYTQLLRKVRSVISAKQQYHTHISVVYINIPTYIAYVYMHMYAIYTCTCMLYVCR